MSIKEFIKQNNEDFDRYRKQPEWNGYTVYHVWAKRNEGACVGLPMFAIEKNGEIRLAEFEEIQSIMTRSNSKYR